MLIPCSFGHSLPVGGPLDLPRLKRQDEDAKTGLDSMYDAHVVAPSFSSLPATHRLVFYLILDMVDTTQAHSHVRGAPLEPAGKGWLTRARRGLKRPLPE